MKWYVLRSISGKENKVKEYIEGALVTSTLFKEYVSQVLIPTEKVVSLRGGKRVIKERNLLPGYVLVECNLTDECYPLLRNIPNVLGFLSDGKASTKPAPVPQSEINKIMGTGWRTRQSHRRTVQRLRRCHQRGRCRQTQTQGRRYYLR